MSGYNFVRIHLYDDDQLETITPIKFDNKLNTVLTVAGSDSSGGAGIEADIKTITAHKCYAATNIVCLTAQNTKGVINSGNTSQGLVADIFDEILSDIQFKAIKTGLLTEAAIKELKNAIEKYNYTGDLVVDPVMVSTSGYDFVSNRVLQLITDTLSPHISLITPNMIEAKALLNTLTASQVYDSHNLESLDEIFHMGKEIHNLTGIKNVLIKGGHQKWNDAKLLTDVLYSSEKDCYYVMCSEMIVSQHTHGTGCTLSSAIASNLANGFSMINAVANGIVYVQNGIKNAPLLGHGNGPLNHIQYVEQYNYEGKLNGKFKLPFKRGGALSYLINHPKIEEPWTRYINHEFMNKINNFELPFDCFMKFLEQNVVYLVNYAHVIMSLASKGKNIEDIELTASRLTTISKEIAKYKELLRQNNYTEHMIRSIKPSKECEAYMNALSELAKHSGDVLDVTVSLSPCFHGYLMSCLNARKNAPSDDVITVDQLKKSLYSQWMEQNTSSWYSSACDDADMKLNNLFDVHCLSAIKLERTVEIFRYFTVLEIEFLNSFLE